MKRRKKRMHGPSLILAFGTTATGTGLDETSKNERVKCAHGGDRCYSEPRNLEFSERDELRGDLTDDMDDFYREGVPFWRRDGAAKYDKTSLINSSEAHEFIFFYKPDTAADEFCLGQW